MSCLDPSYIPQPPREWSRVQNACTFDQNAVASVDSDNMLHKGNVLQYKANSSNLTKQQKYSKIAKGQWTNRTSTWATQSQKYTNPNTQFLKRIGGQNTLLDGTPTDLPVTCNPNDRPIVIQNFGHLLCSVQENICTGKTIIHPPRPQCNPSTDSNVPGMAIPLCWKAGTQTWYPRQRLTMSNSGNKWPVNAVLFPIVPP